MYFLIQWTVEKLYLADQPLDFAIGGPDEVNIRLRPLPKRNDRGQLQIDSHCIVSCCRELSERRIEMFEHLMDAELGSGSLIRSQPEEDHEGRERSAGFVFYGSLPTSLQQLTTEVWKDLEEKALRLVTILRWRYGARGDFYPLRGGELEWSLDGHTYFGISGPWRVVDDRVPHLDLTADDCGSVLALMHGVGREPLGHELFREAWEQRYQNPRSALLVGIAAAEVGCKECIAALAPQTTWLLENLPSPPLVTLVWDYLPQIIDSAAKSATLMPPRREDGRPSGRIHSALMKGVKLRNDAVHRGSGLPPQDTLDEILGAVKDLLWILDLYRGFQWAVEYVTDATAQEWRRVPPVSQTS